MVRTFRVSLTHHLIGLISLALCPIGPISVVQTWTVLEETRQINQASLMEQTRLAAAAERELIQEAFGAARVLARSRWLSTRRLAAMG